jgi:hypothetical protein
VWGFIDLGPVTFRLGQDKSPLGKTLVIQQEAVAIPGEDLHPIKSFPQKDEQVAIERIQAPGAAHDRDEPVVAAAEVNGLRRQVHPDTRSKGQHRPSSRTRPPMYTGPARSGPAP